MSDIELACHAAPWGRKGFINALSDIERAGFRGIEMTAEVVEEFEDRVGVFREILHQHHLKLIAITGGGSQWPGMNLDEEVERGVNVARFLKNSGASVLNLLPPVPNPEKPMEDEQDLLPAATAYGEIARRTLELGVQTCLHPSVGSFVHSPRTINKFIQMADPEAMRLCADVGFLAEAKIPMQGFVKEHKKRIGVIHLKDHSNKDMKGKKPPSLTKKNPKPYTAPKGIALGTGDLDLESFVETMLRSDFSGWATICFDEDPKTTLFDLAVESYKYAEQTLDLVI